MPHPQPKDIAITEETEARRLVADRLRRLRKANGLSLRQLAEGIGTSASFLSQLERGLTGASTSTLIRIADYFGANISELFADGESARDPVLRRSRRPALPVMNGQRKMLLSRRPLTQFEIYVAEFAIGGSSGDEAYSHGDSHEMLLVLRGRVRLDLGPVSHLMDEGDSIEYASSLPHRVENIGRSEAEVLFVISPPTSTGPYLNSFREGGDPPDAPTD
ncbi:MAG: helix-turn-helix domain-containing protein [Pikeienuella sp.]